LGPLENADKEGTLLLGEIRKRRRSIKTDAWVKRKGGKDRSAAGLGLFRRNEGHALKG